MPASSNPSSVAWTTGWRPPRPGVVAVEGDVDRAERDLFPAPLLDEGGEPLGERDAARVDPDERQCAEVVVPLDDLVRDARERARERLCVQQRFRGAICGQGPACSFRFLSGLAGPG